MYPDPLWLAVTYLWGRARQRARAALAGDPEAGILTLEWVVIAGILVAAAVAVGFFFRREITKWENAVKSP